MKRARAMSYSMHSLLAATPLLDLHPDIEALVAERGWRTLRPNDRIGAVYDFVRNDIAFGYNEGDELPASRLRTDGIGQCNTKSTLLMALVLATQSRPGRRKGWHCRQFGLFDNPDAFYARHGSNLSGLKRWVYERVIRHAMNRNVARVRASKW
jgi:hypothetical protein